MPNYQKPSRGSDNHKPIYGGGDYNPPSSDPSSDPHKYKNERPLKEHENPYRERPEQPDPHTPKDPNKGHTYPAKKRDPKGYPDINPPDEETGGSKVPRKPLPKAPSGGAQRDHGPAKEKSFDYHTPRKALQKK